LSLVWRARRSRAEFLSIMIARYFFLVSFIRMASPA